MAEWEGDGRREASQALEETSLHKRGSDGQSLLLSRSSCVRMTRIPSVGCREFDVGFR